MDERQRSPHLTLLPSLPPGDRFRNRQTRSNPPSRQFDQLPPPNALLEPHALYSTSPFATPVPPPFFPANRTSDSMSPPGLHSQHLGPSPRFKSRSSRSSTFRPHLRTSTERCPQRGYRLRLSPAQHACRGLRLRAAKGRASPIGSDAKVSYRGDMTHLPISATTWEQTRTEQYSPDVADAHLRHGSITSRIYLAQRGKGWRRGGIRHL